MTKHSKIELLHTLMPKRISKILIVSTLYEAFIIEKDGQLAEQIYYEFMDVELTYMPKITRVSTLHEAKELISKQRFDLVITMMNLPDTDAFKLAKEIKAIKSNLPVILLLSDPSYLSSTQHQRDGSLDGIFFWSGNPSLFFAIIKCMEDRMNIENDLSTGLIKIILVIEDSPKYYSKFLPIIYGEVMKQTLRLIKDGITEAQKIMRRKTRPKIMLATSYEEAKEIFDTYKHHILGIVSDIAFPKGEGIIDNAGFVFSEYVHETIDDMPIIVMSADYENKEIADERELAFADKNLYSFHHDLKSFIINNMGFGDFIFRDSHGKMVAKASNIKELHDMLLAVPSDSLLYHTSRNHISTWLMARGEYDIAFTMRSKKTRDFKNNPEAMREYIVNTISNFRNAEQSGVVVRYKPGDWDSTFIQVGNGSLGGKARGIAFINYILHTTSINKKFKRIDLKIPKTVAITVEEYGKFIEYNGLKDLYLIDDDEIITHKFLDGHLSSELQNILFDFLKQSDQPLAIRSSSLLEDSHFLPFAGIYSTYMLPNNEVDIKERLTSLLRAIKLVYASTYTRKSKSYIKSTPYKIEDEKMGIVIQEIIGEKYGNNFYPTFSGVAQSYNYYPVSYMKSEEGVVQVAIGLGRLVIEGGNAVRFAPKYPDILPQFFSVADTFKNSQKYYYTLNLDSERHFLEEYETLQTFNIDKADTSILNLVSSVYDINDHMIKEDMFAKGPKVITFANILKYNAFPLSEIVNKLLNVLRDAIGKEIEIEFAVNIDPESKKKPSFNILQVRPLVIAKEGISIYKEERDKENLICRSTKALGNGVRETYDIIFVDPDTFDSAKTKDIAREIREITTYLDKEERNYLLIGMGRWGSADPWLGIPVEWEEISNVVAIVEADIAGFYVDPSQGSHFFQNITSRLIGYFTVLLKRENEFVNWEYLKKQKAFKEFTYAKHIRFDQSIAIKINGKTGEGIILKPDFLLCKTCKNSEDCVYQQEDEKRWNCDEHITI